MEVFENPATVASDAGDARFARLLFGGPAFARLCGALLLLSIPFQTLPFQEAFGIQTLPLTTVFALLFAPFFIRRIPRSPVLTCVTAFVVFAVAHSAVLLGVHLLQGESDLRIAGWLRQLFALACGFATFFVFRQTILHLSDSDVSKYLVAGLIPSFALALLNVAWGAFDQQWAGAIVAGVRRFLSPIGHTAAMRASAFTVEPAAFATTVIITMLPVFLSEEYSRPLRFRTAVLAIVALLSVGWTFSSSALIIMTGTLFTGMVIGPRKGTILAVFLVGVGFFALFVALFPSNQIVRHATSLAFGLQNVSFSDRFYGSLGPFVSILRAPTLVGYGLGGISTHLAELIPRRVIAEVVEVRAVPNIASLLGRAFAETGIIGFTLLVLALGMTFRELRTVIRHAPTQSERTYAMAVRLAMAAVLISTFMTIGPYHTPFFWLWIAAADARYVAITRRHAAPNGV
ncbi:MAG: hypothetical protein QHI48_02025 [Bacteroidota bacterium]|nr:hypothetical protein [Bacteroidota bacterium]